MFAPASFPAAAEPPNPDAIAGAERRRAVLLRLTDIGLALAEEISARTAGAPYHPEPRHDPARSFAAVSRAVRLTVVLEARAEADVIAARKGETAPDCLARRDAAAPSTLTPDGDPLAPAFEAGSGNPSYPTRARVQRAVWEAIEREIGDADEARVAFDRVRERLIEGEDYDGLLSRPWRDCVEAVCADLGLKPDWSLWSDEAGFAPLEAAPFPDAPRFWTHEPGDAETGRRRWPDRAAPVEPVRATPGQGPP